MPVVSSTICSSRTHPPTFSYPLPLESASTLLSTCHQKVINFRDRCSAGLYAGGLVIMDDLPDTFGIVLGDMSNHK